MKTLHLLGISNGPASIVFDILNEVDSFTNYVFYPNISLPDQYELPQPIQKQEYSIAPINSNIPKNEKVFLATPGCVIKEKIYTHFKSQVKDNQYITIIHPKAYIAPSSFINHGVLIEPNATISSQTSIGFGVFVKRNSSVGHHSIINSFVDINPGVTISSNVSVGKNTQIGSGAVIRDGVSIGDNCIIGMGSIVTKNIPSNSIAFGNPCKVIKENPSII